MAERIGSAGERIGGLVRVCEGRDALGFGALAGGWVAEGFVRISHRRFPLTIVAR